MTWAWTAADRQCFQRLRRQLATVLYEHAEGRPTKAAREALARCHRAAVKAAYPTSDAGELATLRQWVVLIDSYLDADLDLERRLHLGGLSTLQMDVALILGAPDAAARPDQVDGEPARQVRQPYRDD